MIVVPVEWVKLVILGARLLFSPSLSQKAKIRLGRNRNSNVVILNVKEGSAKRSVAATLLLIASLDRLLEEHLVSTHRKHFDAKKCLQTCHSQTTLR